MSNFKFEINKNKDNLNAEIWVINLIALLFIYRTAIPSFKYLFMLLISVFILYTIFFHKKNLFRNTKILLKDFRLIFVLFLYLTVAFLFTNKFYLSVFKDLMNALILIIIFWFYYIYITKREELKYSLYTFIRLTIYFSIIISIFSILDLFDIYSINKLDTNGIEDVYIDNNFSLLPIFFGLVSLFFTLRKEFSILKKILYNFLLVLFSFSILLSGSRRGIILFILVYLVAFLFSAIKLFKKNSTINNLSFTFSYFPITLPLLALLMYLFFFQFSYMTKNNIFSSIGTKNKELVRIRLAAGISKIGEIVNKDLNYLTVYDDIWKTVFDPRNPDSGWGKRIHKNIYPLTGKNAEIVPRSSIGYLMDNSCDASYYSNVDVCEAYSSVFKFKVSKGDCYKVSVFCYLSEDFDGTSAYLMLGDCDAYDRGVRRTNYKLSQKGIWQKLELEFECSDGVIPVYIAFMKKGVGNLSNLKGHIIFAYPQYEKIESINYNKILNSSIDPKVPDSGWGGRIHKNVFPLTGKNVDMIPSDCIGYLMDSTCNASYYNDVNACEAFSILYQLDVKNGDQYKINVFCFVSDDFDGNSAYLMLGDSKAFKDGIRNDGYNLLKRNVWQKLELNFTCNDGLIKVYLAFLKRNVQDFSKMKGHVIFAYPQIEKIDTNPNTSSLLRFESIKKANSNYNYLNCPYNTKVQNSTLTRLVNSKISSSRVNYMSTDFSFLQFVLISSDPINKWLRTFFTNDTSYYGMKNVMLNDTVTLSFGMDRIERWKFALKIYKNEYNTFEKIFGGGFYFLNWYGAVFLKDKSKDDYPHNPFLYILLYSGIFGLSIYLFFTYKVFYYYVKYFKENQPLFIFFLIIFFFSFFSGGSPFDPPIMGFFVILPYFIHHTFNNNEVLESIN